MQESTKYEWMGQKVHKRTANLYFLLLCFPNFDKTHTPVPPMFLRPWIGADASKIKATRDKITLGFLSGHKCHFEFSMTINRENCSPDLLKNNEVVT